MTDGRDDNPCTSARQKDEDWGQVRADSDDSWINLEDFLNAPAPTRSAPTVADSDSGAGDSGAGEAAAQESTKGSAGATQSPTSNNSPVQDSRSPARPAKQGLESEPAPATTTAPAEPVGETETTFFDVEHSTFADHGGAQKLGIIGGRGVGKSYLFQAMVYRLQHARRSGALSYFLDTSGVSLATSLAHDEQAHSVNLQRFNTDYERWTRLATTLAANQPWYRLTLPYRTGLLGRTRAAMEVEFFDGSGEQFFEAKDPQNRHLWKQAYADARVVVFCLPLWVAFPGDDLSLADWREREGILEAFHEVVQNYSDMRRELKLSDRSVRSILAFTMADDRRSALKAIREQWIAGYLQSHRAILLQTRRGSGIARYLANARRVSDILMDEIASADSPGIARIPDRLSFGGNRPWLIPVSAIHGEALDQLEADYPNPDDRPRREPPVPVHVELPLLVALCEQSNALI